MTPAVLVRSRGGGRFLAGLGAACLIGVLASPYGVKVALSAQHPAVALSVPELCALLAAALGVIVLRPRLWVIDRLGVPARRWIPATGAAVAVLAGPQLVLALAAAVAMRRETWPPSATTVLFLAALAVLVAPVTGALRAASAMLLLYFAVVVVAQLSPAAGTVAPLAVVTSPEVEPVPAGKVALAAATAGLALAVTVRTLGRTPRTWGRDLDTA